MATVAVSDNSFATDVLQADKPVLVDFWAEWCGPCKSIAPALEAIADSMGDRLTVAKMNVDDNPQTALNYGVRGIPALLLFREGEVAATRFGALTERKLTEWVAHALEE